MRLYVLALLCLPFLTLPTQAQWDPNAAQVRCPQDNRSDADATLFTVSVGTVTLPVGAFLLVRNGSQLGAIRLTSIYPAAKYQGRSNYESFSPPDKSTSFTGSNVDHQIGDIYIGPSVGVVSVRRVPLYAGGRPSGKRA